MPSAEQTNAFQRLQGFLDELASRKIHFRLERNRSEAIMVRVDVPGERWEIEFFADGEVEVEIFRSTNSGVVSGDLAQAELTRLLTDFAD
ncbi:MAG: hypothetical protein HS116_21735 [Planctomycetes bacterium]|nr:hypothetical protein [Planctomycetota bacterium]